MAPPKQWVLAEFTNRAGREVWHIPGTTEMKRKGPSGKWVYKVYLTDKPRAPRTKGMYGPRTLAQVQGYAKAAATRRAKTGYLPSPGVLGALFGASPIAKAKRILTSAAKAKMLAGRRSKSQARKLAALKRDIMFGAPLGYTVGGSPTRRNLTYGSKVGSPGRMGALGRLRLPRPRISPF